MGFIGAAIEPHLKQSYRYTMFDRLTQIGDDFNRELLNTTDAPLLYTSASTGGGSISIDGLFMRIGLTTATAAGDDVSLRTSQFTVSRRFPTFAAMQTLEGVSQLIVDFNFNIATAATSTEGFVGILHSSSALTALPTTTRHLGIFWDASAQANFQLTSADGTTQETTDSGVALDLVTRTLRITLTGDDAGTVQLISNAGAVLATHTPTSLNSDNHAYELHWFVQTETTAARAIEAYGWRAYWK